MRRQPEFPFVSIIIPTYNRGEVLCDTMRMALAQDYPDFEVIVVDQTPDPPQSVRAFVDQAGPRLLYIRREAPNLPGARNAGVYASRGEIIVFIDDDVIIGPEYVSRHVRCYGDRSVGGAMGITLAPGETDLAAALKRNLATFGVKEAMVNGSYRMTSLVGCNCSFRKRALSAAGMFDERFNGSALGEETDLALRVDHLGYMLLLDPSIRLVHLALATGGCGNRDQNEARREEHSRLRVYLFLKNWSIWGIRRVLSSVWSEYRSYSLNRKTLAAPNILVARHIKFLRSAVHAVRASIQGPLVSQPQLPRS